MRNKVFILSRILKEAEYQSWDLDITKLNFDGTKGGSVVSAEGKYICTDDS